MNPIGLGSFRGYASAEEYNRERDLIEAQFQSLLEHYNNIHKAGIESSDQTRECLRTFVSKHQEYKNHPLLPSFDDPISAADSTIKTPISIEEKFSNRIEVYKKAVENALYGPVFGNPQKRINTIWAKIQKMLTKYPKLSSSIEEVNLASYPSFQKRINPQLSNKFFSKRFAFNPKLVRLEVINHFNNSVESQTFRVSSDLTTSKLIKSIAKILNEDSRNLQLGFNAIPNVISLSNADQIDDFIQTRFNSNLMARVYKTPIYVYKYNSEAQAYENHRNELDSECKELHERYRDLGQSVVYLPKDVFDQSYRDLQQFVSNHLEYKNDFSLPEFFSPEGMYQHNNTAFQQICKAQEFEYNFKQKIKNHKNLINRILSQNVFEIRPFETPQKIIKDSLNEILIFFKKHPSLPQLYDLEGLHQLTTMALEQVKIKQAQEFEVFFKKIIENYNDLINCVLCKSAFEYSSIESVQKKIDDAWYRIQEILKDYPEAANFPGLPKIKLIITEINKPISTDSIEYKSLLILFRPTIDSAQKRNVYFTLSKNATTEEILRHLADKLSVNPYELFLRVDLAFGKGSDSINLSNAAEADLRARKTKYENIMDFIESGSQASIYLKSPKK